MNKGIGEPPCFGGVLLLRQTACCGLQCVDPLPICRSGAPMTLFTIALPRHDGGDDDPHASAPAIPDEHRPQYITAHFHFPAEAQVKMPCFFALGFPKAPCVFSDAQRTLQHFQLLHVLSSDRVGFKETCRKTAHRGRRIASIDR
ncbi:hypothetical protein [Sinorhizobium terangae]|uniref:hypothetical protein n=1 Tax=Sinorhizobium terangae TaxID=110322 RepID=UPI0024B04BB0|nr:hypothetical protein [Sinorhizobium terangae]WFU47714.1 hypothetical protein QA637_17990 [Sinorhizobium terangae]